jgi:hypothetical protein
LEKDGRGLFQDNVPALKTMRNLGIISGNPADIRKVLLNAFLGRCPRPAFSHGYPKRGKVLEIQKHVFFQGHLRKSYGTLEIFTLCLILPVI